MWAWSRSIALLALAVATALVVAAPATSSDGRVRAGVASVDASWHVGASAGQYATDGSFVGAHGVDPTTHSYRRSASYGIQSRLEARALVVEGPDGRRVALVKNDLYIPQDLLYRRTAQLLEQGDSGITRANLTIAVHARPFLAVLLLHVLGRLGVPGRLSTCGSSTTTRSAWPRPWNVPPAT